MAPALPAGYRGPWLTVQPAGGGGRVWRVGLAGGRTLAVKVAAGEAALEGETRTLRWLGERKAPTPRVVAVDASRPARWLALSWCGERTLDGALRAAPAPAGAALGRRLAAAVAALEAGFEPISAGLRRRAGWEERVAALRAQAAPWADAAPDSLAWLLDDPAAGRELRPALEATAALAFAAVPDVGSLDYNATNVVVDARGRPTVLDFAVTGVDWPERRLVQYGTGTGAGSAPGAPGAPGAGGAPAGAGGATGAGTGPGGPFRSALDRASVRRYAGLSAARRGQDSREIVATVDAHDVLLLLAAGAGVMAVARGTAHPERARAWADVDARRAALLRLLRRPLAAHGPAAALRTAIRRAAGG